MESICLFEAGGTKTTLLIDDAGNVMKVELPGFNPNRYTPDFENELVQILLPENARLIFYGSGLVSDKNKEIVRRILQKKTGRSDAQIFDDQLGAARAAYGTTPGLIGIMGTGAFAAWYNGVNLEDRKGGYGYLIDDLGGGFELGKVIVSVWLNNDWIEPIDQAISAAINISKRDFTTEFYKSPDLALIASLTKVMVAFSDHIQVQQILVDYFDLFFKRHTSSILAHHPAESITLVGSVAQNFEKFLAVSARKVGLSSITVIGNPSQRLLDYHRKNG